MSQRRFTCNVNLFWGTKISELFYPVWVSNFSRRVPPEGFGTFRFIQFVQWPPQVNNGILVLEFIVSVWINVVCIDILAMV